MSENNFMVSLYVVNTGENSYFAGFNPEKGESFYVSDPRQAKKFTNKFDIKLRPSESIVELSVDLSTANVSISEPFRPAYKKVNRLNKR
jgi:hypothetical protein